MRDVRIPRAAAALTLLLLLGAGARPADAACCAYDREASLVVWAGTWGPDFRSHDVIGIDAAQRISGCGLLYEVPVFTALPLFHDRDAAIEGDGGTRRYNFRWMPSAALLLLERTVFGPTEAGTGNDDGAGEDPNPQVVFGPLSYLLHAPNFSLKTCLTPYLRAVAGTRSDILPYRLEWGERGVLFTPRAGLEVSYGSLGRTDAMIQLTVEAGYGMWWNWDGADRDTGWRLLASVDFYASR